MKTSTTTNNELYQNEVNATPWNELKSLDEQAHLHLMSNAKYDVINVLSWSLGSVNAFCTCALVSRIIYDVEMTSGRGVTV